MGRNRKSGNGLPRRVYVRNGAYYFVDTGGRWRRLCRVSDGEPAMYLALSEALQDAPRQGNMRSALAKFQAVHLPTLAFSTRKEYERNYELIAEAFADFDVSQVQPRHVMKFLGNFADKPTAKHHYKARLSTFFRWCVAEEGLRNDNPCSELHIKTPPRKKTLWTDKLFLEVRELFTPMMRCYHDLSFLLYQRTTDIRLLKWSQINNDMIHFRPSKTSHSSGAEVDIPITSEIRAVLDCAASLAKVRPGPGGDAFVIQSANGDAYSPTGIFSAYRRADKALHNGKRLGLNPKALRPYAATTAKKQGYNLEELKVGLAHSAISTTEGYVHQHNVPVSQISLRLPQKPQE